jgi:hypothetical protein
LKTRVVDYEEAHVPLVKAMNQRLAAGGSSWGFYDMATPAWLPLETPGQPVSRIFHLVRGDDGEIHGGYCFKEQDFLLDGQVVRLATWQGPVSEGLVDKRFRRVGMQCLMDMRDRNPLLYCWGGSVQLNALLDGLGWTRFATPLAMKVLKPGRVLRMAPFLRERKRLGTLAAIAGASGLGDVAVGLAQWASGLRAGGARAAQWRRVEAFGAWSDAIWDAAKAGYRALAVRTADPQNRLMGRPGWPDAEILEIGPPDAPIGWAAIRLNPLNGDKRFGDLRLGSVLDALARPGEEANVIATAASALASGNADLIVANLTHSRWQRAFAAAGFLASQNKRDFLLSPELGALLDSHGIRCPEDFHMLPIDGDGPFGL